MTISNHAKDIEISISSMNAFIGPIVTLLALMVIGVLFVMPTVGEICSYPIECNGLTGTVL